MRATHIKKAKSAIKTLHTQLLKLKEGDQRLVRLLNYVEKHVVAAERHADDEVVRARVEQSVMQAAMRDDLVDREAASARVYDASRSSGVPGAADSTPHERAQQLAMRVEASLTTLCPSAYRLQTRGVAILEAAHEASSATLG